MHTVHTCIYLGNGERAISTNFLSHRVYTESYDTLSRMYFPAIFCRNVEFLHKWKTGLPAIREKSGKFKVRERTGNFVLGIFGKSLESRGKLTFLSCSCKIKRTHDATNWKLMCIAIQQNLKCNVNLKDRTLIGLYNLNNA